MRALLLVFAAGFVVTAAAVAQGPPLAPPTFSGPATEEFLRDLDNRQLRLVRRAIKGCPGMSLTPGKSINRERDPCVIASTDKAVVDSDDPDLQAFHRALPESERYDENRTPTVWRAWLVEP